MTDRYLAVTAFSRRREMPGENGLALCEGTAGSCRLSLSREDVFILAKLRPLVVGVPTVGQGLGNVKTLERRGQDLLSLSVRADCGQGR